MESIVAGGGWNKRREYRVKIKALCCLAAAVLALGACIALHQGLGAWIFSLPAVLLILALLLFWKERPAILPEMPDGEDDPRKLYSSDLGGRRKQEKQHGE